MAYCNFLTSINPIIMKLLLRKSRKNFNYYDILFIYQGIIYQGDRVYDQLHRQRSDLVLAAY